MSFHHGNIYSSSSSFDILACASLQSREYQAQRIRAIRANRLRDSLRKQAKVGILPSERIETLSESSTIDVALVGSTLTLYGAQILSTFFFPFGLAKFQLEKRAVNQFLPQLLSVPPSNGFSTPRYTLEHLSQPQSDQPVNLGGSSEPSSSSCPSRSLALYLRAPAKKVLCMQPEDIRRRQQEELERYRELPQSQSTQVSSLFPFPPLLGDALELISNI